jgi:hypothetical protein
MIEFSLDSLLDSTSDSSFESLGSDMDEAVGGQQNTPANDRRPAWLGEILAAVHQQTTQIQQQATRIEGLENLARGNMMEGVTSNPPTTGNGPVKRPRHKMDDPEKFDGIDLSLYPQFEGLLYAKLEIDSEAIGNEKEKVWYGFSRLNEGAAGRILYTLGFISVGDSDGNETCQETTSVVTADRTKNIVAALNLLESNKDAVASPV